MISVDLSALPIIQYGGNAGKIDWHNSIGYSISFIYNDIKGILKIVDYIKGKQRVSIDYNGIVANIKTSHLIAGHIGAVIKVIDHDYKYQIGDKVLVSSGFIKILKQIRIKQKEGSEKGYIYQCLKDDYIGKLSECNINNKRGCPVCDNHLIITGINDIATTHPYLVKYFVNINDAKEVSFGSDKKVKLKCLTCGFEKKMSVSKLVTRGFSCPKCGDKIPYPEKFVFNILQQLNINFETQKIFDWFPTKLYDFYIPSFNCIIETHGAQHYYTSFGNYQDREEILQTTQNNDENKYQTAIKNNIQNYIVIDCRDSDINWIKNNVLKSKLLAMFDLSKIDWLQCHEFACSSRIKEACNLWDGTFETMLTVCDRMKICRPTLIKFLRQGTKLGWCNYNAKRNMKENCRKNGHQLGIPVEVFDSNGKSLGIFPSATKLSEISLEKFGIRFIQTAISACCRGVIKQYKGFTFKTV